jgi:hypothetical protein
MDEYKWGVPLTSYSLYLPKFPLNCAIVLSVEVTLPYIRGVMTNHNYSKVVISWVLVVPDMAAGQRLRSFCLFCW